MEAMVPQIVLHSSFQCGPFGNIQTDSRILQGRYHQPRAGTDRSWTQMVQSQSIRNTSNYAKSRVGVGIPLLRGYVYPLLSEVIELLFQPLLRPYGLIAGLIVLIIATLPWTGQWQKQYRTGLRHLKPCQQWSGHDSLRGGGLQQQQIVP